MARKLPILICSEMVKAILEGRKSQTQLLIVCDEMRPLGPPYGCMWPFRRGKDVPDMPGVPVWEPVYPLYQVGDELWVKEPHYLYGTWLKNGQTKTGRQEWRFTYAKSKGVKFPDAPPKNIHTKKEEVGWFKRLGRFMPKRGARLWLRVTAVKNPHQVQTISPEDCIAEGIEMSTAHGEPAYYLYDARLHYTPNPVESYHSLWNRLHPKPGERWEDNPYVFGYEFQLIKRLK